MANDREITQKKERPGLNPDDIKTAIFCLNEKIQIVHILFCTTMFDK